MLWYVWSSSSFFVCGRIVHFMQFVLRRFWSIIQVDYVLSDVWEGFFPSFGSRSLQAGNSLPFPCARSSIIQIERLEEGRDWIGWSLLCLLFWGGIKTGTSGSPDRTRCRWTWKAREKKKHGELCFDFGVHPDIFLRRPTKSSCGPAGVNKPVYSSSLRWRTELWSIGNTSFMVNSHMGSLGGAGHSTSNTIGRNLE